ncbi:MAG: glycosyltransferase family 2 protein, partial [candidate division Zixibacteria bacterium]|nr:glycosyltransferase family 2 protein [candidate division Zixibacteria bacterium]
MNIINPILFILVLITSFCCLLLLYSVLKVVTHSKKSVSLDKTTFSNQDKDGKMVNQFEANLPPVSILKPLQGTDPGLKTNLSSFCQMDYPVYELVFCLEKEEDPALDIVREL